MLLCMARLPVRGASWIVQLLSAGSLSVDAVVFTRKLPIRREIKMITQEVRFGT